MNMQINNYCISMFSFPILRNRFFFFFVSEMTKDINILLTAIQTDRQNHTNYIYLFLLS